MLPGANRIAVQEIYIIDRYDLLPLQMRMPDISIFNPTENKLETINQPNLVIPIQENIQSICC